MRPVVVLPDAELAVLDFLRAWLVSLPRWSTLQLGTLVPAHRPFLQIRRVGGSSDLPGVDAPRVDVIAYHATDYDRMALARDAWAFLVAAASTRAGDARVSYLSTVMGPRQMPDPADDTRRVVMLTVDLLVRPVPPDPTPTPEPVGYGAGVYGAGVYGG